MALKAEGEETITCGFEGWYVSVSDLNTNKSSCLSLGTNYSRSSNRIRDSC